VPIIGATKIEHLEEAVGALSVKLTDDEIKYLEEPYRQASFTHTLAVSGKHTSRPQSQKYGQCANWRRV
jgi:diketogulonate reductase-like aldo/keto reductase